MPARWPVPPPALAAALPQGNRPWGHSRGPQPRQGVLTAPPLPGSCGGRGPVLGARACLRRWGLRGPRPPAVAARGSWCRRRTGAVCGRLTPDPSRAAGAASSVSRGDASGLLTSSLARATLSRSRVATGSEVRWAISLAVPRRAFLTSAKRSVCPEPLASPHFENKHTGRPSPLVAETGTGRPLAFRQVDCSCPVSATEQP